MDPEVARAAQILRQIRAGPNVRMQDNERVTWRRVVNQELLPSEVGSPILVLAAR